MRVNKPRFCLCRFCSLLFLPITKRKRNRDGNGKLHRRQRPIFINGLPPSPFFRRVECICPSHLRRRCYVHHLRGICARWKLRLARSNFKAFPSSRTNLPTCERDDELLYLRDDFSTNVPENLSKRKTHRARTPTIRWPRR